MFKAEFIIHDHRDCLRTGSNSLLKTVKIPNIKKVTGTVNDQTPANIKNTKV